jgi:hypothetical protein
MKELLPIGSVVLLNGGKKRVMICGRIQKKVDDDNILYDYSACYFHEGIINPRELFLFNNEDIDKVYFVGLQDVEEFKFRDLINQKLEEYQNKKS